METLTYRQLYTLAPGAAALDSPDPRLLNTYHWVKQLVEEGFAPVFGMQGKTHEDGGEPWMGRHLVICAREDGAAFSLLNSHCRLQRVWAGVGVWHDGELLLAKVIPLQRWKWDGWALSPKWDGVTLSKVKREAAAMGRKISVDTVSKIAEKIARTGYIGGRGRPAAQALVSPYSPLTTLSATAEIVGLCRKGNLVPSTKGRRNVKGIRRPDAYQHLALAAWKAAVEVSR